MKPVFRQMDSLQPVTPPALTLRVFSFAQDYPAVIALWEQSGPGVNVGRSDRPEEILKKLQRDPDLFLVAEMDGQLVGTVLGGFDGRRGIVYHLAVDRGYRQKGIGTALMEELEDRLRAKGCLRCYLLVVAGNEEAARFYEVHGWEKMPTSIYGKNLA